VGLTPVIGPEALAACRAEIAAVQVEDGIMHYITAIAQESRKSPDLTLGASARASIALLQTARAYAALQGRAFVVPDDVKLLARPVYRHRIMLRPEAEIEGLTADTAIGRILSRLEVPR
jgi:MoxR-like ATPase